MNDHAKGSLKCPGRALTLALVYWDWTLKEAFIWLEIRVGRSKRWKPQIMRSQSGKLFIEDRVS